MPKLMVSVIIPAYNAERYIDDCINSVIKQTYDNIEIIIVDDGSHDSTPRILDEYAEKYTNVRVFHKKNEGVSVARNYGIECAKGDYITFVDADDVVSSSFISEAVEVLSHFQADIVLGNTVYWKENHKLVDETEQQNNPLKRATLITDISVIKKKVLGNGREKGNPLNGVFTSGPVCKLFRAAIIAGHRFPVELSIGEDTVFNLEVLSDAHIFAYAPCDWYYYRLNIDSATQKYNPKARKNASDLIEKLETITGVKGEEYTIYLQERAIQQFNGLLMSYVLHPDNAIKTVQRIRLISEIINDSPWREVFSKKKDSHLPGNIYDKVLLQFCIHKASLCVFVWARIREYILKLRNKSE